MNKNLYNQIQENLLKLYLTSFDQKERENLLIAINENKKAYRELL